MYKIVIILFFVLFVMAGCAVSNNIDTFKTFIESSDHYKYLSIEKLEYPKSVRTKLHSKQSDLGPEWEYVLTGKVDRQIDLRNIVEAVYRMDLQDKISIDVRVVTEE